MLGVVTNLYKTFTQLEAEENLKATVKRVSIRSRRLYVNGEVDLPSGRLPFELSSGAGLRENGI